MPAETPMPLADDKWSIGRAKSAGQPHDRQTPGKQQAHGRRFSAC
jgi:hypothetical protein